jgi:predicted enzyme related to lactoylglutathione lyase
MATIVHFELPSADTDRAKAFWSDVFGWKFGGMTEPFVYLMTEGEEPVGAIFQSDTAGSGPIVYMATDDIDATIAKVRDAGGSADDKEPIPQTGWISRCKDTEGNAFSLFQSDDSAPGSF